MLPFVFNAGDEKNEQEERYYDPSNHQKEMEEYYKQYEQKQVNSRIYRDTVGLSSSVTTTSSALNDNPHVSIEEMQRKLAETKNAILKIHEEKEQFHHQLPQSQQQFYPQYSQFQTNQPPPYYYPHQASAETVQTVNLVNNQMPESAIVGPSAQRSSRSPSWARDARRSKSNERKNKSRSQSRSRSRSRERHRNRRSRSRSRDRHSRRRRDHRSRTRSRSPSSRYSRRRRSRSTSREWVRDKYDEWHPGPPCNKLALLNLPNDVDNAKITFALGKSGYLPQDVRTMTKYDKLTKQVRTFAFVEFFDQETAKKWMDQNQGWLYLEDGRKVVAEYAKSDPQLGQTNKGDDWICAHCAMNNFVKRQNCFKCEISKEQSRELERQGVHMVGISPCDTLLIRGLPDKCETTTIFDSLLKLVCLNSISMIKLSESKKFAYIQMKSTDEATMLLNLTYKQTLKIRNKDVQVTYCRDSMTRLIHQQMTILTQGAQTTAPTQGGNLTGAEIAAAAISKAQAVRQASHQVGQMMSIPTAQAQHQHAIIPPGYNHQQAGIIAQLPPNFSVPPPTIGSIGVTMPPTQAEKPTNGIIGVTSTPRGALPKYATPIPASFLPDANSGYYLDPVTNFFYDSRTGYYYNNEAKIWCTWDPTYETYFAVEESNAQKSDEKKEESPEEGEEKQDVEKKKKKKKEKEDDGLPKKPVDVAKDMLKWAKKQEKDKKKVQMSLKVASKSTVEIKNVFHAEKKKVASQSLVEDEEDEDESHLNIDPHTGKPKSTRQLSELRDETGVSSSSSSATAAAAAYYPSVQQRKRPTAAELREAMERELVDESKKMCLLCKRAFPSVDVLRKHVEKSELHRTNLEQKRLEWGKDNEDQLEEVGEEGGVEEAESVREIEMPKIVYRDRAKERRKQYGIDSTGYAFDVMGKHGGRGMKKDDTTIRRESEEAAKRPLDDRNIGNRLLKNMGWKEGQGVGKHGQGIVNPIQAERFVHGAGLGSSGSKIRGGVEASHKEKTRQALFSRYNDA